MASNGSSYTQNSTGVEYSYEDDRIKKIQKRFKCSHKVATMAYKGFSLYIPHLWLGNATKEDGSYKGESLVYGVMRNLDLGFLSKTRYTAISDFDAGDSSTMLSFSKGEEFDAKHSSTFGYLTLKRRGNNDSGFVPKERVELTKKAINITLNKGKDGGRDYHSCRINFDRLFKDSEEQAGNFAILEHLLKEPIETNGKLVHNHLQVEYQPAGKHRYTGEDEPARFWKVYLWRDEPSKVEKPVVTIKDDSKKVKFSLVSATSKVNSAAGIEKSVSFADAATGKRANAVSPPGSPDVKE